MDIRGMVNQRHKYLHPAFRVFLLFLLSPCGSASPSCASALSFSTASTSFLFLFLSFILFPATTSSTNTVLSGSSPGTASATVVWKVTVGGVVVVPARRTLIFAAKQSATDVVNVRIWSSTAGSGAGSGVEGEGESAGHRALIVLETAPRTAM
jgi:hypothetical protein